MAIALVFASCSDRITGTGQMIHWIKPNIPSLTLQSGEASQLRRLFVRPSPLFLRPFPPAISLLLLGGCAWCHPTSSLFPLPSSIIPLPSYLLYTLYIIAIRPPPTLAWFLLPYSPSFPHPSHSLLSEKSPSQQPQEVPSAVVFFILHNQKSPHIALFSPPHLIFHPKNLYISNFICTFAPEF